MRNTASDPVFGRVGGGDDGSGTASDRAGEGGEAHGSAAVSGCNPDIPVGHSSRAGTCAPGDPGARPFLPDGGCDTEARIALLARCVTPARLAAFERAAAMRTRRMTVLAENTYHGQNAAALVRHCEAFGLQRMHTVEALCPFRPSADVVRGTDKWVDIVRHPSTTEALAALRGAGFRIVATTPHRRSCTTESFRIADGPFALVFGTEHAGISPEVAAAADEFLCIPMCGMVESLNVSASAAIVICRLAERMRAQDDAWRLPHEQQRELVLRWLRSSVRSADEILRDAGFDDGRRPRGFAG